LCLIVKVKNVVIPYGIIGHHLKERYVTLHSTLYSKKSFWCSIFN